MNEPIDQQDPTTESTTTPKPAADRPPAGAEAERDSAAAGKPRRRLSVQRESRCRFCRERVTRVDYKDVIRLQALCRSQGRIMAAKRSGNCAWHQRMVKRAIKQARFIGLMSHVDGPGRAPGRTGRSW